MAKIDHLIVLMFENRSFDHMLGFYKPLPGGMRPHGVTPECTNPYDPFAGGLGVPLSVRATMTSGTDGYVTDPDPPHEHDDVKVHLYGMATPADDAKPTNNGFLYRYS